MLFVCYEKCGTCKKAEKYLRERGHAFRKRDIKSARPSLAELTTWHKMSGLPLRRFFNTSGTLYKEMHLKEKLALMTEEEQLALLAADGMLVKRPLLIGEDFVLAGFKTSEWEAQGL